MKFTMQLPSKRTMVIIGVVLVAALLFMGLLGRSGGKLTAFRNLGPDIDDFFGLHRAGGADGG